MLSKQTVLKSFTVLSAGLILASASPLLVNQVEAADKIKINYWHVNADTQGGKTVNELVEAYNDSQDEVEVVATFNPDMYKGLMQNLQAAVTSGETPDVVQVGWAFKDYFSENFEYTDPIQLVQEVDPDNKDFFEKNFLENVLNLAKKDDSYVGIPYSVSNPVLYINKDLLKEAGLDENGPQTWEQVQEFSKTIKEKTGKFGLYVQEPADSWAQQALLESNGAAIMTDGKASFGSEEGIHAYQVYQDMVVKDESALHTTWEQGIQSFIDGNVAMLYTTIAQRNNVQSNANFAVTAIKSPTWEGKENKLPAGGAMLAVTSQDEEKKKGLVETVMAYDGIAIVVSPENKVEDLDIDKVAAIYKREITDWKDLGGAEGEIVVIGREAGSGTRDGFESITKTKDSCKYRQELTSTGDVITAVASNPNAIGYASLSAVKDTVKALKIGGVAPSEETVKDGTYVVQRPFVFVTKEGTKLSDTAQKFFDFALSSDANDIIISAGVVPAN